MALNYLVKASNTVTIEGIIVTISAEFQQGNLPTVITARAAGKVPPKEADESIPAVCMDLNANYNVARCSFNNCNGSHVPAGFIQKLETAIAETYDLIKAGEVEA